MKKTVLILGAAITSLLAATAFAQSKGEADPAGAKAAPAKAATAEEKAAAKTARKAARAKRKAAAAEAVKKGETTSGEK